VPKVVLLADSEDYGAWLALKLAAFSIEVVQVREWPLLLGMISKDTSALLIDSTLPGLPPAAIAESVRKYHPSLIVCILGQDVGKQDAVRIAQVVRGQ
jgi:DNA-binding response OmpR family regulator